MLCSTVCLVGGLAVTPVAASTVVNRCGGESKDYVGLDTLDKPFQGSLSVNGTPQDMSITPMGTDGRVKVELNNGKDNPRYAISHLVIRADSTGMGVISFSTFAGDGWSTGLACDKGTRVTQINGIVEIANGVGDKLGVEFSAKRA